MKKVRIQETMSEIDSKTKCVFSACRESDGVDTWVTVTLRIPQPFNWARQAESLIRDIRSACSLFFEEKKLFVGEKKEDETS